MVRPGLLILSLSMPLGGDASDTIGRFDPPSITYPVHTPGMMAAIGDIDRALDFQPLRSVAIVGADDISAQWLRINNAYLSSINAIALVVNVSSEAQLELLRQYTDIVLLPRVGDFAIESYGAVYPILIDATAARLRQ